jgi:hypothetical protein
MSPQLADVPKDEFRRHFANALAITNRIERCVYTDNRALMSDEMLKAWQHAVPRLCIDRYTDVRLRRGWADVRYACDTFDVRHDAQLYRIVWIYCENGQNGECGVSHVFHVLSRDFDATVAILTESLFS